MSTYAELNDVIKSLMKDLQKDLEKSVNNEFSDSIADIPVGISNRHIHLSSEDLEKLFGKGYKLTPIKDLSQIGQYAAKEVVTICGPKGAIENVRVLGPVRTETQVEILAGDNFKLGINAPVRMSAELKDSAGITIIGKCGSVQIKEGVIIAKRHIHMTLKDADRLGVKDKDIVDIEVLGERGGILSNVAIRANDMSSLECHLDMEEANALGLTPSSKIRIKR